jgi:hypothetical protein
VITPDPVYELVADMFDKLAADLDSAALRIRRNAEFLRAAGPREPDDNTCHSLKVVPDKWPQL